MGAIRVVLADDDDAMRSALVDVLGADPRLEVVGEASNGHDVIDLVVRTRPDVVLLDVRMPGGGPAGCRALLEDVRLDPLPVVVAVSASTEVSTVTGMLRAGASGYLGKGWLGGSLADLVLRCADGQVMLALPNARAVLRSVLGAQPVAAG